MGREARPDDVVIVGYDMVTPLGTELSAQWEAFAEGRSGIKWIERYAVGEDDPVRVSGEVPPVNFSAYRFWNERDAANWFSPVIFHSMLVAERACEHAGLVINEKNADRVGVTFSSAIGGLDAMIAAEAKVAEGKTPHPFTNPNGCLNLVGGKVSILLGAQGPIYSPVAACATGAASVANAAMLLQTGRADVIIAGACDFPVIRSLLSSFASMNGAFRSHKPSDRGGDDPSKVSRPFSSDRKGFVVSEGAAAFVVTTRRFAEQTGLNICATVEGVGMTSDAKHYVAPNLPTIVSCIRRALEDAGLRPAQIDAVNAHAASTNVGDRIEADALRQVFGRERTLPVVANKSQIGHTMGASSGIELICTIEGLQRGKLLPTINYQPDEKVPVSPTLTCKTLEQRHVLTNSFGFGGCNVCLIVGR